MSALGERFGRLVVTRTFRHNAHSFADCLCDCGTKKPVRLSSLRSGDQQSCGCYRRQRAAGLDLRHGEIVGGKPSSEWIVWRAMRQRCDDPNHKSYASYGGRGIRVCERWQDFANFLADMGRRPGRGLQIDRIDNAGNYEPGNCRWATPKENSNNRRPARARTRAKDRGN